MKAMAPHSSTLAWKIPWLEGLVGCSPWGRQESDTTERLHFHFRYMCNDARLFHFSYQRYLENQIREVFGLQGTPIRITIRQKGDKEE